MDIPQYNSISDNESRYTIYSDDPDTRVNKCFPIIDFINNIYLLILAFYLVLSYEQYTQDICYWTIIYIVTEWIETRNDQVKFAIFNIIWNIFGFYKTWSIKNSESGMMVKLIYYTLMIRFILIGLSLLVLLLVVARLLWIYRKRTSERKASLNAIKKYTKLIKFGDIIDSLEKYFDCKTCNICLEDFTNDESLLELNCHHIYHKECIEIWLTTNKCCPQCRNDIDR